MKTFALDTLILTVGDTIIHRNLGYTAVIKNLTARGNGTVEIPDTPQNRAIWESSKLPKVIKANNIPKFFKKQILTPKLDL